MMYHDRIVNVAVTRRVPVRRRGFPLQVEATGRLWTSLLGRPIGLHPWQPSLERNNGLAATIGRFIVVGRPFTPPDGTGIDTSKELHQGIDCFLP